MLEIILWVVLGLVALVVALLGLMVVVGYVTQIAYLEHLDDWDHHD
jgi:hypothetical protein